MRTKTYFLSDFHLGINARTTSMERERCVVRWMDMAKADAAAIYLVGDVFDQWFEYGTVIPKGYARLFGKLAELREAGIPIYFFTGNHDMWMFRYFETEFGIPIYREPVVREIDGKVFFIGHGDGLGPGDYGYKFIKWLFANPLCQWLFRWIHPDWGLGLMHFFSGTSRKAQPRIIPWLGEQKERLWVFSNKKLDELPADFFIFGHRHLPIDITLKNGRSRYINLGEWMHFNSYAVWDGRELTLRFFENPEGRVVGNA